jgi:hypothetical protein
MEAVTMDFYVTFGSQYGYTPHPTLADAHPDGLVRLIVDGRYHSYRDETPPAVWYLDSAPTETGSEGFRLSVDGREVIWERWWTRHSNGAEFYDETGRQIDFEIPGNDNGEVAELAEEEVNRWYAIRTEVEEEYGIRDLDRRIESETRRRYLESRPVEDVELPDVAS